MLSVVIPIRFPHPQFSALLDRYERLLLPALRLYWGKPFEVILVPNPLPKGAAQSLVDAISQRPAVMEHLRVCETAHDQGKGVAVREGIRMSRGEWIWMCDADLPFDLNFLDQARKLSESGVELVTANRRMMESEFRVSVRALSMVYRRHLIGLVFNWFVRLGLPISSRDTQAGMKWMSRRLADRFQVKQRCPGFFFDLELFLIAQLGGFRMAEVPVVFSIQNEKSTVRIVREGASGLYWLAKIMNNVRKGLYRGDH